MKANFKYVTLMAAALTLGLSSCSNDDSTTGGGLGDGMRGEPTTINIMAKQSGGIGTYAIETTPTAEEAKIESATTYIFDGAGALEVVRVLTASNNQASATGVRITTGPKTFYIVANAPQKLADQLAPGSNAVTPGHDDALTKAKFEKLLANDDTSISKMETLHDAATGYFMTTPEGGKQQTLNPGPGNSVSMKIGRAFSKTNVEFNPASVVYEANLGGKLTNAKYLARNNKDNTYNQAIYSLDQLMSYRYDHWEPETGLGAGPLPALVDGDFFIEGGSLEGTAGFPASSQHFKESTLADGTKPLYAMENANSIPLYGTATFVQIGGKWVLDAGTEVFKADNLPAGTGQDALNSDGDFYRIVEFNALPTATGADAPTRVVREISKKYYNATPETTTKDAEIATFKTNNPIVTVVDANVGYLMYEKGQMYYSVYLTNPAAIAAPASETFMVERNKYYYVTVKSINRLGSNTAETTNPGEEIETEVDIDASIEVGDWADASSNADL